jgi:HK97 family phage portal protein
VLKFRDFFKKKSAVPQGAITQVRLPLRLNSWLPHWLRTDYSLKNSELLFAAVSRLSNALASMPVQLYQNTNAKNNDLNDIVSFAPNQNMTSTQFFKTMEACRCTSGNAYALKIYDINGILERLDVLDPSKVTPILEDESGDLWYQVQPEMTQPYYIHGYYMVHIPFLSTNGITGINPVSVLHDTLAYSEDIQKFSRKQLEKGLNVSVVLEAPANLGAEQREAMLTDFMDTYIKSNGDVLLLESGVQAKSLNLSPVDTKLFEVEKITRSKVAMVYGIPAHLLNDYSDVSFASQEQQMLEFLMLTMLPIVTGYEQELNRKLLTRDDRKKGLAFRFNMDSILRADAATQADVYQKAIRGGWMKPNEVRGRYSLANEKSGNTLLVSRDLTTLDYIVNNPDKTPQN